MAPAAETSPQLRRLHDQRDRARPENRSCRCPSAEPVDKVLTTDQLVKVYGGRAVVDGINLNVKAGEIVGLLGPNGAGKTTTFYMIVGLVRPNSGRVVFSGTDVTDYPMYKRARLGMGYLAAGRIDFSQANGGTEHSRHSGNAAR